MVQIIKDRCANGEKFITTDGYDYTTRELYVAMCKATVRRTHSWKFHITEFTIAAKFGDYLKGIVSFPFDSYSYQKLLGDKYFYTNKLQTLFYFKPIFSLLRP